MLKPCASCVITADYLFVITKGQTLTVTKKIFLSLNDYKSIASCLI